MILLDTSGLLAAYDRRDPYHESALGALRNAVPPRLLSPFVLAELDYLVGRRVGARAQTEVLAEVSRGAYDLVAVDATDVTIARRVIARHADLRVGLTDASLVVLAHRHGAHDLLSLDERHFRVLQGPDGPFRLLPADA